MRRGRGFSLIELLIVIAIILALAALAIPNLMRSKISANEASAVSSIRTIATAQTTYAISYPAQGYADQLTKLAQPHSGTAVSYTAAGLLDWLLACPSQPCPKSGYQFSIGNTIGTPVSGYTVYATPLLQGETGRRGFCGDQVPRITVDPNGGTTCTEPLP